MAKERDRFGVYITFREDTTAREVSGADERPEGGEIYLRRRTRTADK